MPVAFSDLELAAALEENERDRHGLRTVGLQRVRENLSKFHEDGDRRLHWCLGDPRGRSQQITSKQLAGYLRRLAGSSIQD